MSLKLGGLAMVYKSTFGY